jgi:hypothetical protein
MSVNYSENAGEAFGNTVAQMSDLGYFKMLWGEGSETYYRAWELVNLMQCSKRMPRIKHSYVKPGMFGWQCDDTEDGKLEWIHYRGFVSQVIKKEDGQDGQGPCVELYKGIVAYLIREGDIRKGHFESRYSDFASFSKTFERLYENVDPGLKKLGKRLQEMKKELEENAENVKRLVYQDIVRQIETNDLLSDPAKYFDKDQCDSLAKLNPELFSGCRAEIEHSLLGLDLKNEVAKRLNLSQV